MGNSKMKVLVTGGTGMVGSSFKRVNTEHELILLSTKDCNLKDYEKTNEIIKYYKPDAIIHLAAKVAGLQENTLKVSDFFYENILINTNVLESAKNNNVKKLVSLLSTCVYPDKVSYPLTEEQFHSGEPHQSNFGYAYAKRMLEVHTRAIRKQYKLKYITAIPNNLYGENDNFDLENSHVIPGIIRKIYESKVNNTVPVFWGSGKTLREFTYAEDISRALLFLLENYDDSSPINIGKTGEIEIKKLVEKISSILGYNKKVFWDKDKPEGQFRKPSSNEKFLSINREFKYTSLDEGLEKTCRWFEEKYPNVRGID
jgi:GDP-L-fucose synthase